MVRFPMEAGMAPLSWLPDKSLDMKFVKERIVTMVMKRRENKITDTKAGMIGIHTVDSI